jgi:hypothetical protein
MSAMIAQERAALFEALAELCRRYPNWRFGQLVSNVSGWADVDIWDIEDDQLLAAVQAHLDDVAHRESEVKA